MAERPAAPADSAFGASAFDRALDQRLPTRWIGWRLRLLVTAALIGCVGLFVLTRWLAMSPALDAVFQASPQGSLTLISSPTPALNALAGRSLSAVVGNDGAAVPLDALALQRSPRWQVDDARRRQQMSQQEALAQARAPGHATLVFNDGTRAVVAAPPRGIPGLGLLFWPLAALALLLYLVGVVVVLARPQARNALFLGMTWCQAGTLLFIAIQSMPGLGLPAGAAAAELMPRLAFDLFTAAAAVHVFALHPRRLPGAGLIGGAAWAAAWSLLALAQFDQLPQLWWWAQGAMFGLGAAALAELSWSYRIEPNPFAAVMRRFGLIAAATLLLVTLGTAVAAERSGMPQAIAVVGSVVWYLFFASLLLLVPFLSRSKQVMREFALLAGISTVATSLDLLFVALFSLGQFASLTLAVFLSLGAYASARQWILNQMVGTRVLTTERTFEQLYRVAREVQEQPSRYSTLLTQLLRELFEPLEVVRVERAASQTRLIGGGSALVVPVRPGSDDARTAPLSLVLRFARRGQRLFTADDARLADRVVDQLRRAVAYDQAVERGRNEERLRIAQDLHDDIGARLLTLMYKAQSPEIEEYVRHTLQDLKTLTRGLAATDHRLSHAAAEWKADLTQRLTAANMQLGWSFEVDRDLKLSVVQWSALTRVLRELVSNTLYHAQASRIDVSFHLAGNALSLSVADDGNGRDPQSWSHGLGLGGVRKRVKLLGGEVHWRENQPRGIVCEVRVPKFAAH
jgi:signal transduction histidine kinase